MGIFDFTSPKEKKKEENLDHLNIDERIIHALKEVYDPEIPVNIYEMGLIYRIDREATTNYVNIDMTLTTPNCPAAQELPAMVQSTVEQVPDVTGVKVEIVWDPPWGPEQMSEEAKMELGFI